MVAHQLELGGGERRDHGVLGWSYSDLRDFELHLRIDFQPFTYTYTRGKNAGKTINIPTVLSWKRARKVAVINGRGSIVLTKQAELWAAAAAANLREQWEAEFHMPLPKRVQMNAAIVSYLPTRRETDASNLYQGPEDVLQTHRPSCKPKCSLHAGILEDDVCIRTHNRSDRRYDKHHPRVEITLTPWRPELSEITTVRVSAVAESATNPRKRFDAAKLDELAESMRSAGVLQPILVRPHGAAGKFECVFGHRRLRAANLVGLEAIPAVVREMTDLEVAEAQLAENCQRADIGPLEEADAYKAILDAGVMTAEDIAAKVGKSKSHVYGRLRLAELGPKPRHALEAGA